MRSATPSKQKKPFFSFDADAQRALKKLEIKNLKKAVKRDKAIFEASRLAAY